MMTKTGSCIKIIHETPGESDTEAFKVTGRQSRNGSTDIMLRNVLALFQERIPQLCCDRKVSAGRTKQ